MLLANDDRSLRRGAITESDLSSSGVQAARVKRYALEIQERDEQYRRLNEPVISEPVISEPLNIVADNFVPITSAGCSATTSVWRLPIYLPTYASSRA